MIKCVKGEALAASHVMHAVPSRDDDEEVEPLITHTQDTHTMDDDEASFEEEFCDCEDNEMP